jgi:hypothetical protein
MGLEDGVVGAVNVAEEEHVVVVSRTLTSYKLYEFMHCLKSFNMNSYNQSISSVTLPLHQIYTQIWSHS